MSSTSTTASNDRCRLLERAVIIDRDFDRVGRIPAAEHDDPDKDDIPALEHCWVEFNGLDTGSGRTAELLVHYQIGCDLCRQEQSYSLPTLIDVDPDTGMVDLISWRLNPRKIGIIDFEGYWLSIGDKCIRLRDYRESDRTSYTVTKYRISQMRKKLTVSTGSFDRCVNAEIKYGHNAEVCFCERCYNMIHKVEAMDLDTRAKLLGPGFWMWRSFLAHYQDRIQCSTDEFERLCDWYGIDDHTRYFTIGSSVDAHTTFKRKCTDVDKKLIEPIAEKESVQLVGI